MQVDHFSKYGLLEDSDDEDGVIADQQMAKMKQLQQLQQQRELMKQQQDLHSQGNDISATAQQVMEECL